MGKERDPRLLGSIQRFKKAPPPNAIRKIQEAKLATNGTKGRNLLHW